MSLVGLAIALFVSTNLDDVFVLLAFFADKRFRAGEIVLGQLLGIFVLALGSWLLSRGATVLPSHLVGWLGLGPVLLGVWIFVRKKDDDDPPPKGLGAFAVMAVTIANGADNVAAYVPFFAVRTLAESLLVLSVFLVMTFAWCFAAQRLIRHPTWGSSIQRWGGRLLPFVLVALGVWIFVDAGAHRVFTR